MDTTDESTEATKSFLFRTGRFWLLGLYLGTFLGAYALTPLGYIILIHSPKDLLFGLSLFYTMIPGLIFGDVFGPDDGPVFILWVIFLWVITGVVTKLKVFYGIFFCYVALNLGGCWVMILSANR